MGPVCERQPILLRRCCGALARRLSAGGSAPADAGRDALRCVQRKCLVVLRARSDNAGLKRRFFRHRMLSEASTARTQCRLPGGAHPHLCVGPPPAASGIDDADRLRLLIRPRLEQLVQAKAGLAAARMRIPHLPPPPAAGPQPTPQQAVDSRPAASSMLRCGARCERPEPASVAQVAWLPPGVILSQPSHGLTAQS